MRLAKGWIWAIVFGAALLALIGWRVATHGNSGDKRGGFGGGSHKAPSVDVSIAGPADIESVVNVVGQVQSPQTVNLTSKITGRILYLSVRQGDPVMAGEVLVKIDPSDLNQQILQQQASVAEAQQHLAQAEISQNANNVGVTSQIQQQQAGLTSAQADYNQTQQNYSAQVETAQASVADADAKLNAAEVGVTNAQAQLAQQQANLKNAQTNYQRMQTLFTQGAVSQQARDDAETAMQVQQQAVNVAQGQVAAAQAYVTSARASVSAANNQLSIVKKQGVANIAASKAKVVQAQATLKTANANQSQSPAYQANIKALQAAVDAAQAQLQAAKVHLQDTELKSPIDGVVTARNADPGSMASPGSPLVTVQKLDWVYINAAIPMDSAAGVHEGMNAQITVDGLPGQVFTGPITNVNPSADPQTRQFTVLIRLENPRRVLKPGMYARVSVVTQKVHAAVAVPIEAISQSGSPTVTVVDRDTIAHVVPVTIGASDGKTVQITSGMAAGDQVVTLTYSSIKDGEEVVLPGAQTSDGSSSSGHGSDGSSGGHRRHGQS